MTPRKILVTGGVRSGKSRHAEQILAGEPRVSFLAPAAAPDPASDPDWAARVAEHRRRRPPTWTTVETPALAAALRKAEPPVLVDSLGTWLTGTVDALDGWDQPMAQWQAGFDDRLADLVDAWRASPGLLVAVTSEVGWGLVSEHRSGRVFTDLLGRVNQEVAAVSDEVILVVAGRALRL